MNYFYYLLGYDDEEIEVNEKIKRQRHLVMKQIKESKIKLKNIEDSLDHLDVELQKLTNTPENSPKSVVTLHGSTDEKVEEKSVYTIGKKTKEQSDFSQYAKKHQFNPKVIPIKHRSLSFKSEQPKKADNIEDIDVFIEYKK